MPYDNVKYLKKTIIQGNVNLLSDGVPKKHVPLYVLLGHIA